MFDESIIDSTWWVSIRRVHLNFPLGYEGWAGVEMSKGPLLPAKDALLSI